MCEGTAHSAQRGFRRGKLITDNVIELEARIVRELYTGARCPALLLIDIKAAFPSVAWDWLWYVLDFMDFVLVCAVKAHVLSGWFVLLRHCTKTALPSLLLGGLGE